jgi:LysM repeat protein
VSESKPRPKEPPASEPAADNSDQEKTHGFYHAVEKGETLSIIVAAYNEHGVKVTVDDIRKANNLSPNSVLKIGQKLFIPKK